MRVPRDGISVVYQCQYPDSNVILQFCKILPFWWKPGKENRSFVLFFTSAYDFTSITK